MGAIGNIIGTVRYVDLPVAAGAAPTVSYTTDAVLDLIGIEVLAAGATAAALKVGGSTVAGGAIASFANDLGSVYSAAPAGGVPTAAAGGGAQQANSTTAGNVNWQSSGTAQPVAVTLTTALTSGTPTTTLAVSALPFALNSGDKVVVANTDVFTLSAGAAKDATSLTVTSKAPTASWGTGTNVYVKPSGVTDRNGSVPDAGALTPISAAIAASTAVEVDLTGTVTVLDTLPAADGQGFISLPSGNSQAGFTDEPSDNIPFRVKASDTELDTFAGFVRLFFQVPVNDPNTTAENAGTYPKDGVQQGSHY